MPSDVSGTVAAKQGYCPVNFFFTWFYFRRTLRSWGILAALFSSPFQIFLIAPTKDEVDLPHFATTVAMLAAFVKRRSPNA